MPSKIRQKTAVFPQSHEKPWAPVTARGHPPEPYRPSPFLGNLGKITYSVTFRSFHPSWFYSKKKLPIFQILIDIQFFSCVMQPDTFAELLFIVSMGARRGGWRGGSFPPSETERIVVEKLCYFPELCKMTEVRVEWIENGSNVNFPLRFLYVNFKIFSINFNSYVLSPNAQRIAARILKFYKNY